MGRLLAIAISAFAISGCCHRDTSASGTSEIMLEKKVSGETYNKGYVHPTIYEVFYGRLTGQGRVKKPHWKMPESCKAWKYGISPYDLSK